MFRSEGLLFEAQGAHQERLGGERFVARLKQFSEVQQGGPDPDVLRPERSFLDRQGAAQHWLSRREISGSL